MLQQEFRNFVTHLAITARFLAGRTSRPPALEVLPTLYHFVQIV